MYSRTFLKETSEWQSSWIPVSPEVDFSHSIQNFVAHYIQHPTRQLKVRTTGGLIDICVVFVSEEVRELESCSFHRKLIYLEQRYLFGDEQFGLMVLKDEWGREKTSDGTFLTIIQSDARNPQEKKMVCGKISIWISALRWLFHPWNKTIRHLILQLSVVRLFIVENPPYQIVVFLSALRWSESLMWGWMFSFVGILLIDWTRRIYITSRDVFVHSTFLVHVAFSYYLEFVLPFTFNLREIGQFCANLVQNFEQEGQGQLLIHQLNGVVTHSAQNTMHALDFVRERADERNCAQTHLKIVLWRFSLWSPYGGEDYLRCTRRKSSCGSEIFF